MSHPILWLHLTDVMLSEKNHIQKHSHHMIP